MGVIVGGWEYVIAAYTLTGLAIFLLILWILRNHRSHLKALDKIAKQGDMRRSSGCKESI